MRQPETILDFGTSKIVCIIGDVMKNGHFDVHGIADSSYRGIKKGEFINELETMEAAINAIDKASNEAKRRLSDISIGVPGQLLEFDIQEIKLVFDSVHIVSENDIENLIRLAKNSELANDDRYKLIDMVNIGYTLNNSPCDGDPIDLNAKTLSATFFMTYMKSEFEVFVEGILRNTGLKVSNYFDSAFCESMLLSDKNIKDELAIIVDVGYYHTDICIFKKMLPIHRHVIMVGGANFANDLVYVLHIPGEIAENIKRRHVFSLDYSGRRDSYKTIDGQTSEFDYNTIQEILEARAEELILLIKNSLVESKINIPANTRVFLSGGGLAMMRGAREFFQNKIGLACLTNFPQLPKYNSLRYLSSYGLLRHAYEMKQDSNKSLKTKENSFVNAIINFFTK